MFEVRNPPHPGKILRDEILLELEVSLSEAARALGVSRTLLSRFINERSRVSLDLAIRLGTWLGGDPHTWLRLQANYDLWHAKHTVCILPRVEQASSIRP